MGTNTFILDRRTVRLFIGDTQSVIGTLRRFFKITEFDSARSAEVEGAARLPSPSAVMVMEVSELPFADASGHRVCAHLVLGWDEGMLAVAEGGWDYLPVLGYAVRHPRGDGYRLFEERGGTLRWMDRDRASVLGLVDANGGLIRKGQPRIIACRNIRPYIDGYAEADCVFDTGMEARLLVAVSLDDSPPECWFVGKRPIDVRRFRPSKAGDINRCRTDASAEPFNTLDP